MLDWKEVCSVFETLERTTGRLAIMRSLSELFSKSTPEEVALISYLSLGELHPQYVGTQFSVAAKTMIRCVALYLDVPDVQVEESYKNTGDLGTVAYEYLKPSGHQDVSLSLVDVYNALCVIEQTNGPGSTDIKIKLIVQLLGTLDPLEAKYVVRVILGKLRLGFSDMTLLEAFSYMNEGDKSMKPLLEHAYNVCADIGAIGSIAKKSGAQGLATVKIIPGIPIRPAAAERLPSSKAIIEKLGPAIAQPKLDGFRLQIHFFHDTHGKRVIRFFSRHLQDMSDMFPDLVEAFKICSLENFIAEGEAIGYNPETGDFMPFQETVKRRRKHGVDEAAAQFPLQLFMFDLLYCNDAVIMGMSHADRRVVLQDVLKAGIDTNVVKCIDEVSVKTAAELESYFLQMIQGGLEGVVVKRPDAHYQPGKRNFNWIKLKRQEEGHIEDTIDAVILGYYYGKGKRASFGIGAFLVGVYNQHTDMFETIAKIGTGLTDAGWHELRARCDEHLVGHKMARVMCPQELYPDVWVEPSLVCVIRADEITRSPLHTAGKQNNQHGFALRFPRMVAYRDDKGPSEATTADEIIRLYNDQYKQ